MSEELFEVAFSGKIIEGADIEQVKAKVAAMFKADAAKLEHLFSGKRVVIKKNIDQATANKYQQALKNAGAQCEVKSLSTASESVPATAPEPEAVQPATATPAAAVARSHDIDSNAPAAPKTDPLGITASDISDLSASMLPVGSDMQDEVKEVAEPDLDLNGLDLAPPGSDLGEMKKGDAPPPPDTSGMTLADSN